MGYLTAYSIVITLLAVYALLELKVERASSRMTDTFRENDRKFYRKWEDIWFEQLNIMAERSYQPKLVKTTAKKPNPSRRGKKG